MSFTIWFQLQYVFFLGSRAKWVPLQIELKVQDKDQVNTNLTSPESDSAGGRGTHKSPSWRGSSPGSRGSRGRRGAGGMFRGGRGRQRGSGRGEHFLQLNTVFSSTYSFQHIFSSTYFRTYYLPFNPFPPRGSSLASKIVCC